MTFEPEEGLPLYINGIYVECKADRDKDEGCADCCFQSATCENVICAAGRRHDHLNVHFVKYDEGAGRIEKRDI